MPCQPPSPEGSKGGGNGAQCTDNSADKKSGFTTGNIAIIKAHGIITFTPSDLDTDGEIR
jgi:hypothetical protein